MDQSGFEPAHRRFFTVGQSLSLADWPGRLPAAGHPTTQFIRAATPMWPNVLSRNRTGSTVPSTVCLAAGTRLPPLVVESFPCPLQRQGCPLRESNPAHATVFHPSP